MSVGNPRQRDNYSIYIHTISGRAWKMVSRKIMLDQLTLAPFMISSFFIGTNMLEGNSMTRAKREMKEKFVKAYILGMCFWPFVNSIQWRMVPPPARPIWSAIMAFTWANVLCYLKTRKMENKTLDN